MPLLLPQHSLEIYVELQAHWYGVPRSSRYCGMSLPLIPEITRASARHIVLGATGSRPRVLESLGEGKAQRQVSSESDGAQS